MTDNTINAYCSICGHGYRICSACSEQKKFRPWRTVTDTIEHYKIYMAIHGYTITKDRETAKTELQNCDLSGLENFNPEIKAVIKEILAENRTKGSTKLKKEKQNGLPESDEDTDRNPDADTKNTK